MFDLLLQLEPRQEQKGVVLFEENEEVSEVLFFSTGEVGVGYELNKVKYIDLKFKNCTVIGDHHCTFNKRTKYFYQTLTNCKGYSIHKRNWQGLLKNHPLIADEWKDKIKQNFEKLIHRKIIKSKKATLIKIMNRADFESITKTVSIKETPKKQSINPSKISGTLILANEEFLDTTHESADELNNILDGPELIEKCKQQNLVYEFVLLKILSKVDKICN